MLFPFEIFSHCSAQFSRISIFCSKYFIGQSKRFWPTQLFKVIIKLIITHKLSKQVKYSAVYNTVKLIARTHEYLSENKSSSNKIAVYRYTLRNIFTVATYTFTIETNEITREGFPAYPDRSEINKICIQRTGYSKDCLFAFQIFASFLPPQEADIKYRNLIDSNE